MRRLAGAAPAIVLVVVAAACTGAGPSGEAAPSPLAAPPSAAPVGSVAPSSPTRTSSTPAAAALAAYERYTAASAEALAAGEVDERSLSDVADGQAVASLQRRTAANRRDGVVATGELQPSATVDDVRVDGSTAVVTDCVLNGLESVSVDDPDRVVTAATGWRQPVTARLANRSTGWVVTSVKVPLRDGSGPVPPPPDEPPYLRGPAEGPAPPSCVPPDLARAAVEGYRAFVDAYDRALGYGGSGPVDPEAQAIDATTAEPQLSMLRNFVRDLRSRGEAFRGRRDGHDPWAVAAKSDDSIVIVYDCVTVGSYARVSDDAAEPRGRNDDEGSLRLDGADLVRMSDLWKVAGVSTIDDGLQQCTGR